MKVSLKILNSVLILKTLTHVITFANSLDPDQDLNPLIVFLKDFCEKVNSEKADDNKSMKNYPASKELMLLNKMNGVFLILYTKPIKCQSGVQ